MPVPDTSPATDSATTGSSAQRRVRVCFHRANALPVFCPEAGPGAGGAEVRSALFARSLARRPKFAVSFLVRNWPGLLPESIDGVRLLPEPVLCREQQFACADARYRECVTRSERFPWRRLRKWSFRLPADIARLVGWQLYYRHRIGRPRPRRVVRSLPADVFCLFGCNPSTAGLIASCQAYGLPSILFLIHDDEVSSLADPTGTIRSLELPAWLPRYCIDHASAVVAQSEHQQQALAAVPEVASRRIRNPVSLMNLSNTPQTAGDYVLWTGRALPTERDVKRPGLLWELARQMPDIPFVAVLNAADPSTFATLQKTRPANVEVIERIPPNEMDAVVSRAAFLCNTSISEGFPNTFLAAAAQAKPVLSLRVDPDGMLSRHAAGIVCDGQPERFVEAARLLWSDAALRERLGRAGRVYVEQHHETEARTDELARLITQLTRS